MGTRPTQQKLRAFKKSKQLMLRQRGIIKIGIPRQWTPELIDIEEQALIEWMNDPTSYYVLHFAVSRGYNRTTLDLLCKLSESFSATLQQAQAFQEARLIDLAVTKEGDPGFIKFVLSNKHDWKERTELSGSKEDPLASILIQIDGSTKDILE